MHVEVGRRLVVVGGGVARGVRAVLRVAGDGTGRTGVVGRFLVARAVHDKGVGRRVGVHRDRPRHALRLAHLEVLHDPLGIAAVFDPLPVVGHALERGALGQVVADAHEGRGRGTGVRRRQGVGDVGAGCRGRAVLGVGRDAHRHVVAGQRRCGIVDGEDDHVAGADRVVRAIQVPAVLEQARVAQLAGGLRVHLHHEAQDRARKRVELDACPRDALRLLVVDAAAVGRHEARAFGHVVGHGCHVGGRRARVGNGQNVGQLLAFQHRRARARVGGLLHVEIRGRLVALRRGVAHGVRAVCRVGCQRAGRTGVAVGLLVDGPIRDEGVLGRVSVHRDGPRHALVFAHLEVFDHPLGVSAIFDPFAAVGCALVRGAHRRIVADAHELRRCRAGVRRRQGVGNLRARRRGRAVLGVGRHAHRHVAAVHRLGRRVDGQHDDVADRRRVGAAALVPAILVERGVAHLAGGRRLHLHGKGQRPARIGRKRQPRPRDAVRVTVVAAAARRNQLGAPRHVVGHAGVAGGGAAGVGQGDGVDDLLAFQHGGAGRGRGGLARVEIRGRLVAFRRGVARGVRAARGVGRDGARRARISRGSLVAAGVHDEGALGRIRGHRDGPRHALVFAHLEIFEHPLDIALVLDPLAAVVHTLVGGGLRHVVADAHELRGLVAGVGGRQGVGDVAAGRRIAAVGGVRGDVHRHLAVADRSGRRVDGQHDDVGGACRVGARRGSPAVLEQRSVAHLAGCRLAHPHSEADGLGRVRAHGLARPHDALGGGVVGAAVGHRHELGAFRHVVDHGGRRRGHPAGVGQRDGVRDLLLFQHGRAGRGRRGLARVEVRGRLVAFRCGVAHGVGAVCRVVGQSAGRARVGGEGLVGTPVRNKGVGGHVGIHRDGPRHALRLAHLQVFQHPLDIALVLDPLAAVVYRLVGGARGHVVANAHVGHGAVAGVFRLQGVGDGGAGCRVAAIGRVGRHAHRHLAAVHGLGGRLDGQHDHVGGACRIGARRRGPTVLEQRGVAQLAACRLAHPYLEAERLGRARAHGLACPRDAPSAAVVAAVVVRRHELGAFRHVVGHSGRRRGRPAGVGQRDGVDELLALQHRRAGRRRRTLARVEVHGRRIALRRGVARGVGPAYRVCRQGAGRARVAIRLLVVGDVGDERVGGHVGIHHDAPRHALRLAHLEVFNHPLGIASRVDPLAAVGHALVAGPPGQIVADAHELRRCRAGVFRRQGVGDGGAGCRIPAVARVGRHVHRHLVAMHRRRGLLDGQHDYVGGACRVDCGSLIAPVVVEGLVAQLAACRRHLHLERDGFRRLCRHRKPEPLDAPGLLVAFAAVAGRHELGARRHVVHQPAGLRVRAAVVG